MSKTRMGRCGSRVPCLVTLLGLATTGCCSDPDIWSYKLTCATWAVVGGDVAEGLAGLEPPVTDEEAMAQGILYGSWALLMGVPVALDTALVPVTAVHDIFFTGDPDESPSNGSFSARLPR
ncbi:MAG: hypothetical protein HY720_14735 [Planctomycetes bacterium]|nr:hypothetical protein [Planctomycetota bacterium]